MEFFSVKSIMLYVTWHFSSMSCCIGILFFTVLSLHCKLLEYIKCTLITYYFSLSVMQPKGLSGPIPELARRRLYQEVRNIHCIKT